MGKLILDRLPSARVIKLLNELRPRGIQPRLVNGSVEFTNAQLMTEDEVMRARMLPNALPRYLKVLAATSNRRVLALTTLKQY